MCRVYSLRTENRPTAQPEWPWSEVWCARIRDMYNTTIILIQESSPLLKPQGAQESLSAAGCPRVGAEDAVVIHIPVRSEWQPEIRRYITSWYGSFIPIIYRVWDPRWCRISSIYSMTTWPWKDLKTRCLDKNCLHLALRSEMSKLSLRLEETTVVFQCAVLVPSDNPNQWILHLSYSQSGKPRTVQSTYEASSIDPQKNRQRSRWNGDIAWCGKWVFPKIWVPQNWWFIMETPWFGGKTHHFRKHPNDSEPGGLRPISGRRPHTLQGSQGSSQEGSQNGVPGTRSCPRLAVLQQILGKDN